LSHDIIRAEAEALVFTQFTEDTAWELGNILVAMARADALPVIINIRTANRCLFHAALPGSKPLNDLWVQRKSSVALLFGEPSFSVGLRHAEKGEKLAKHGLDTAQFADHGGAVPIYTPSGIAAVATVSGLPQVEDHALVMRALRALHAQQS
jgi:uncharacterized protein (UPF0303 family)